VKKKFDKEGLYYMLFEYAGMLFDCLNAYVEYGAYGDENMPS
jgi:hypothetical protein